LAAGQGQRMRPLTDKVPKPLLEVNGKTLLEHQISFLKNFVDSIAVTVGYLSEKVAQGALRNDADFILQNGLKGNANWLNYPIIRRLNSPIVVITCDNLMELNFVDLEIEAEKSRDSNYLVTRKSDLDISGDKVLHTDGLVRSIKENLDSPLLATGLQVINPSTLSPREVFDDFHEVWDDLISRQLLRISRNHPTKWAAIDTPSDLKKANESK